MSSFHPLKDVSRGNEIQLQVGTQSQLVREYGPCIILLLVRKNEIISHLQINNFGPPYATLTQH